MSKFYLANSSDSDEDSDTPLPFPEPLSRNLFTSHRDFSPTAFLASLHNRHQSLEDLRLELRNRSKDLERELLELVNRDYVDFLGLGSSLSGGEAKVEDLRVGLLQMRRELEGLVNKIEDVLAKVQESLKEREAVRGRKNLIRILLSISHRLTSLEISLLLDPPAASANPQRILGIPSITPDEEESPPISLSRLLSVKTSYLILLHLISRVPSCPDGSSHPFLIAQQPRIDRIRKNLLLDLGAGLKEAIRGSRGEFGFEHYNEDSVISDEKEKAEVEKAKEKLVKVLEIFKEIGEDGEAIKFLKEIGRGKEDASVKEKLANKGQNITNTVTARGANTQSRAKMSLQSNIGITQQQPGIQRMQMGK